MIAPDERLLADAQLKAMVIDSTSCAHRYQWFRVETDSMEPTFWPGDVVFCDLLKNVPGSGGYFLVQLGGNICMRRIEPLIGGGVRVGSENALYGEAEILTDDEAANLLIVAKIVAHLRRK